MVDWVLDIICILCILLIIFLVLFSANRYGKAIKEHKEGGEYEKD